MTSAIARVAVRRVRGIARSCSARHSAMSRAPTPVGSRFCTCAQRDLQLLDLDVAHRGERRLAQLLELLLEVAVLVEVADHELARSACRARVRPVSESCCSRCSCSVGSAAANCVKSSRSSSSRRERASARRARRRSRAPRRGSARSSRRSRARCSARRSPAARLAVRRRRARPRRAVEVGALEQRVLGEVALELLVELDRRQLQQPDRLLQLRREREVLR